MKVLFLQHVLNVWKVWEIKDVSDSYVRNVLLPKWFVKIFTKEEELKLINKKKKDEQTRILKVEHRHEIFDLLNWKNIDFFLKKDALGKTFWSIWEKEIIEWLKKNFKIDFSKSDISMPNWHIKKIWLADVFIKIWDWVTAKILANVK